MVQDILKLQQKSAVLEPSPKDREDLMREVYRHSAEYLNNIGELPAYDIEKPISIPNTFDRIYSIKEVLKLIEQNIDRIGINPASPGHLGYIPGGGIYASALGDYLADISNKYAGLRYASPGAVVMENHLIDWTRKLINYPITALGNLTSGGSIANLIAIITARDARAISGEKINKSVIYLSGQTHHCIQKAIRIAGLNDCPIRYVGIDDQFRMDPVHLRKLVKQDIQNGAQPFMVIASCGSTDTGAVDQFDEIGFIAEEYNLWYHIDAAYGGYFMLCDPLKNIFKGIERSDSIVLDPHKTLFLPYGSGLVIIREGDKIHHSFKHTANYLQDVINDDSNISPADLSPELTKHFRGLRMWLPLMLYGQEVFSACLEEKHLLTKYFHQEIQKLGFEVGPLPQLSVAIYRYVPKEGDPNEFNTRLTKAIQQDGRIYISSTSINDIYWLRIAVVCFRTHLSNIQLYLSILKEKVSVLANTP